MTADREPMSPPAPRVIGPPGASTVPGRVAALDGLRGVAVLMVVTLHYYAAVPGPPGMPLNDFLQSLGSLFFCGVDLFFVLSGFFIGGILLDHRASPRLLPVFYLRRFFRIVPIYALLLVTFYVAAHVPSLRAMHDGVLFSSRVPEWSFFTFTQNILMAAQRDPGPWWLGPTWSLAIEEQFYLIIPWVILRLSPGHLMRLCLVLIVLSPVARLAALTFAHNPLAGVFLLPMHADGLLAGVVCALLARNANVLQAVARRRGQFATVIAALAVFLGGMSLRRYQPISPAMLGFGYSALNVFFALVVLYVVAGPRTAFARALSFRPLAAVGVGSYFIYLFHAPIWFSLHAWFRHAPPLHLTWQGGAVTLLALVATLLASVISWRCLEAPLLRIGRRSFQHSGIRSLEFT